MFTPLRNLVRGVFLAFAAAAIVYSAATAVYADVYPMGDCRNGYCYFLSCGSSAGNYYYKCDQSTGVCDDCDTSACTDSANYQCEQRGYPSTMLLTQ